MYECSTEAKTANELRKQVIAYFDDQIGRLDAEKRSLRPTKKIDLAVFNARRRQAENNRQFFYDLKIDGKGYAE